MKGVLGVLLLGGGLGLAYLVLAGKLSSLVDPADGAVAGGAEFKDIRPTARYGTPSKPGEQPVGSVNI